MKTTKVMVLMLSSIILGACTNEVPIEPQKIDMAELQHDWKLTHVDNIQVATVINSSLTIDEENKSSGNLGCNNFFGEAEVQGNQLRIGKMGNTRKMCESLQNDVEMDVSQVLSGWSDVLIDDDTLIIGNNKHSLTYKLVDSVEE
ncbi:META domain-containing protein [Psychromonas aquatilis]|uniref:META domain-containing protein n=1 Tax=Psychromonas aquatilis TaxID=2005072 RepID=A0ABU9GMA0_9GAMM